MYAATVQILALEQKVKTVFKIFGKIEYLKI